MSSEFGIRLKISVFGESHGKAVGVVINGLPAGERVDQEELQMFMSRRRPGVNDLTTARREKDVPVFLSGLKDGATNGAPLCIMIENGDMHSSDYSDFLDKPRPSHADFVSFAKWHGAADMNGGGHFSGRLTAPLCAAGGIAKQILARHNIFAGAHLYSVAGVEDVPFPLRPCKELFDSIAAKKMPVINDDNGNDMVKNINAAKADLDSVGGVIECAIIGVPAGIGEPMFDGAENRIACAVFGIPAVKGIEFGAGFAISNMRGSEANDAFMIENSVVATKTNNSGGLQGGITNGMPIVFRVAVKPTPSIGRPQITVSLSKMEAAELAIKGRHDPCVVLRAVPAVESAAMLVMLDMLLEEGAM